MKKVFEEYGSMVIVVVAILLMLTLLTFLVRPGGAISEAFQGLMASFSGDSSSAPALSVDKPAQDITSGRVTITGTVTSGSDAVNVVLRIGGTEYEATVNEDGTWSAEVDLETGMNVVTVVATNSDGKTTTATVIVPVDMAGPVLELDEVPAMTANRTITVSGTATSDDAPVSVVVFVNETKYETTANGDGVWSIEVDLEEGSNSISVEAADALGKTNSATATVLRDSTKPVLTVNPLTDLTTQSTVTVSGKVTDEHGVKNLSVNGKAVAIGNGGTWSADVTLAEGENGIEITARDNVDNIATATVMVIKDTTGPELVLHDLPERTKNSKITVSGTVLDASGVSFVTVKVNSVTYSASINGDGYWSVEVHLTEGGNNIVVETKDSLNNHSSASDVVNCDITPPEVTIGALPERTSKDSLTIAGSVSDASGIDHVLVSVNGKAAQVATVYNDSWSVTIALEEGNNEVIVTASDNVGNNNNATGIIVRDSTVPELTMDKLDSLTNKSKITVTGHVADTSGIASVIVTVGDKEYVATLNGDGSWSVEVPLLEGNNDIRVVAKDTLGNAADLEGSIICDTTAPVLDVYELPELTNNETITISGKVTDVNGIASAVVSVNGTEHNVSVGNDGKWSVSASLNKGTNAIAVKVTDVAGNISTYTGSVSLDTDGPVVTLDAFDALTNQNSVAIAGTVSDASGIGVVEVNGSPVVVNGDGTWMSTVALTDGDNTIVVVATDRAGNSTTLMEKVTRDNAGPELTLYDLDALTDKGTITVSGKATDASGLGAVVVIIDGKEHPASVNDDGVWSVEVPLLEGSNSISVKATDALGNTSMKSAAVKRDSTAPVVTLDELASLTSNSDVSVSGKVTDASKVISLTVNGTAVTVGDDGRWMMKVVLSEGSNTITVVATDEAGNIATVAKTVVRDSTGPQLTVDEVDSITNSGNITISGTVNDASGVDSVLVNGNKATINADGVWNIELALSEGTNVITVEALDKLGNRSTETASVLLDSKAPTLNLANTTNLTTNDTTTISGTVSDANGIVSLTVNGTVIAIGADGSSWSATVNLKEGANTITVVATDAAGNTTTKTKTVTKDSKAPELSLNPLPGLVTSGTVTVSGTVSDANGIDSVIVTVGGKNYTATVNADGYWIVEVALDEGNNAVKVTATDKAGNSSTKTGLVNKDTTPPTLDIDDLPETTTNETITVSGVVTDAGEIASVMVNGIPVVVNSNGTWSVEVNLSEGDNAITVVATDTAGLSVTETLCVRMEVPSQSEYVLSGEWQFNENITLQAGLGQNINFTSNGIEIDEINCSNGHSLFYRKDGALACAPPYQDQSGEGDFVWLDEAYRVVNFGEEMQEVSQEFYEWFTANAVKQGGTGGSEPVLGTVTIEGMMDIYEYTYEVGMTWADLVNSKYNTDSKLAITSSNTITIVGGDSGPVKPGYLAVTSDLPVDYASIYYFEFGSNEVVYFSDDVTGGSGSGSQDTTAPDLTVDAPSETTNSSITVSGTASDASGITSLTVNGKTVTVGSNGAWSTTVALAEGSNTITVIATDGAGNKTTVRKTVVYTPAKSYEAGTLVFKTDGVAYFYGSKGTVTETYTGWMTGVYDNITDSTEYVPWYGKGNRVLYVIIEDGVTPASTQYWFNTCFNLKEVSIGNGVKEIGRDMFAGCRELTSVVIPDSVITIGEYAFENCDGMTSLTFETNSQLVSIGKYAFMDCESLTSIALPNKLSSIGDFAFYECTAMKSVSFPSSVKTIGEAAFRGCTGLTNVTLGSGVTQVGDYAFAECKNVIEATIGISVKLIGKNAFAYCSSLSSVKFLDTTTWYHAYNYEQAISGSGTQIDVSDASLAATYLGSQHADRYWYKTDECFHNSTTVKNAKSATCTKTGYTGDEVCSSCGETVKKGTSIAAKGHSTTVKNAKDATCTEAGYTGDEVCSSCGVTLKVGTVIPATGVHTDRNGDKVCDSCGTNLGNLGPTVTTATVTLRWEGGILATFTYEVGMTWADLIGSSYNTDQALCLDSDGSVMIAFVGMPGPTEGDELPVYGTYPVDYAEVYYCYPSSVSGYFDVLCYEWNVTGGTISSGCEHTNTAVQNAKAATCTEAGYTGDTVCTDCGKTVAYGSTIAATGHQDNNHDSACDNCGTTCYSAGTLVFKPDGVAYLYGSNGSVSNTYTGWMTAIYSSETQTPWYNQRTNIKIVVIEDGVSPGSTAYWFGSFTNLTSVTIGDNVASIGEYAFYKCGNLTSVTIGDGVTSIGMYTFNLCTSLDNVTIPNSVTSIDSSAFTGCKKLARITIPDSVTVIGDSVFAGCSNLQSVVLPKNLTRISNSLFSACSNLSNITIPSKVTYIDSYAFYQCGKLTDITIPGAVTYIGSDAFNGCTGLSRVNIPYGVTTLGGRTFKGCTNLTSVTFASNSKIWWIGLSTFEGCSSLTSVTIPSSVTKVASNAFLGCSSLIEVIFADTSTWYYTTSSADENNGTQIDVSDASLAATYLVTQYVDKHWYKK